MSEWFRRRYIDLLGSIYIYNEHRGYTAIDRVLEAVRVRWPDDTALITKIEKQALKLKNKISDKSHRAAKVGEVTSRVDEVQPAPQSARIINARRYAVKPMSADEAALALDGHEDQFLVFRNSENERISVIYKRKDGNYGLIQP